jgi:hypothetical protein
MLSSLAHIKSSFDDSCSISESLISFEVTGLVEGKLGGDLEGLEGAGWCRGLVAGLLLFLGPIDEMRRDVNTDS